MKQNAVIEHLKQKKTMTPAEREENQRLAACVLRDRRTTCLNHFNVLFLQKMNMYEYHFWVFRGAFLVGKRFILKYSGS